MKIATTSPEKSHPLFSSNPLLSWGPVKPPPPFWKFGWRHSPPCRNGQGVHIMGEGIKIWWGGRGSLLRGGFFQVWGMSEFLANVGGLPKSPSRDNPLISVTRFHNCTIVVSIYIRYLYQGLFVSTWIKKSPEAIFSSDLHYKTVGPNFQPFG